MLIELSPLRLTDTVLQTAHGFVDTHQIACREFLDTRISGHPLFCQASETAMLAERDASETPAKIETGTEACPK